MRQRVLRHPARRHRRGEVDVDHRQQVPKLNGLRADRVGGLYMSNFTVQQAEFNAVYVLETDGFVIDRLIARGNDEYGILAFASDHGAHPAVERLLQRRLRASTPAPPPTSTATTTSSSRPATPS